MAGPSFPMYVVGWNVDGKAIAFDLNEFGNARNVLYAFTADGELMYVGKTVQPLRSRMIG